MTQPIAYFWFLLTLFAGAPALGSTNGGQAMSHEYEYRMTVGVGYQGLQKGDKVALISPAASADPVALNIVSGMLEKSGLIPAYDATMNAPQNAPYANQYEVMPYASADAQRLAGFQRALESDAKALWILHGGQGCEKIVAALERGDLVLPNNKKIIIGFSGVTNLHLYFLDKGWPCLHANVGTIGKETAQVTHSPINTEASLQKVIDVLMRRAPSLTYTLQPVNDLAKAQGAIPATPIVGGCLNILVTHIGTPTALVGAGKIVLIEDEPQRPERIETMFMGLIRAGTFKDVRAVILGSFSDPAFNHQRFQKVKPVLLERLAGLLRDHGVHAPVFHAENFGHGSLNDPLPLGMDVMIESVTVNPL